MAVIALTGDMDLQNAVALVQDLEVALAAEDVDVETQDLVSADVSIAQVLLGAFRSARVCGHRLSIAMPKDGAIERLFGRLGMLSAEFPSLRLSPGAVNDLAEGRV